MLQSGIILYFLLKPQGIFAISELLRRLQLTSALFSYKISAIQFVEAFWERAPD